MRLDHLLSREGRSRESHYCLSAGEAEEVPERGEREGTERKGSGGDAPGGDTRSHPEHAARACAGG